MKISLKIACSLSLIYWSTGMLFGQEKTIRLFSADDRQVITEALVQVHCLSSSQPLVILKPDQNGQLSVTCTDSFELRINSPDYELFIGVFSTGGDIYLKPKYQNLDDVVVSASFAPVSQKEAVFRVESIDEKKIEAKAANNLREVLTGELNFRTNNGHVNETALNLNGLSGNHIKFLIDGVPVEGRLSGNIDLSQINMNDVERIEVIDGPSSVVYGSNAMAGTINIITKKSQAKKISIQSKAYYESIGQYNLSAAVGYKFKQNTLRLSVGRNFFSGFSEEDTSRLKTWKPREQYFGSLMYTGTLKYFRVTYVLDAFSELMTDRGALRAPYFVSAFDTYYRTQRLGNKVLLNGKVGQHHFLDLTMSHNYFKRTRNIYFKDMTTLNEYLTTGESDQDTTVFNSSMVRIVFLRNQKENSVNYTVGAELKHDQITASRVSQHTRGIADYSIFASMDLKPVSKLTIKPALRYGFNTAYKTPLIPSLNLLYNPSEMITIRSSYARGFRAPDLKELYLEFHYNSTINLWGNQDLKAENSDHVNLAIDVTKKFGKHGINITTKGYYSKINDLISLVRTTEVDWVYSNVDYLITRGFSMQGTYTYHPMTITVAYNYYGNYNSAFNKLESNKYFYTSDASAALGFTFEKIGLRANVFYKYTGRIKSFYLTDEQEVQASHIGDFSTIDMQVSKLLLHEKVTIGLGVKNLFNVTRVTMAGEVFGVSNQNNADVLNVLWGRSVFVSLNFRLP